MPTKKTNELEIGDIAVFGNGSTSQIISIIEGPENRGRHRSRKLFPAPIKKGFRKIIFFNQRIIILHKSAQVEIV